MSEVEDRGNLYTPSQVADRIDVKPYMIGIYYNEFEPYIKPYTIWTKDVNGHRRYTEDGLKVFMEVRRLLDQPGYNYQKVREEFQRRQGLDNAGPAELINYENRQVLETLKEADSLMVKEMFKMVEAYKELTEANRLLVSKVDDQTTEIENLKRQLENMPKDISAKVSKEWAKVNLEVLEARGEPGFFARLFGGRSRKNELEEKEYYRNIVSKSETEKGIVRRITDEKDNEPIE